MILSFLIQIIGFFLNALFFFWGVNYLDNNCSCRWSSRDSYHILCWTRAIVVILNATKLSKQCAFTGSRAWNGGHSPSGKVQLCLHLHCVPKKFDHIFDDKLK